MTQTQTEQGLCDTDTDGAEQYLAYCLTYFNCYDYTSKLLIVI